MACRIVQGSKLLWGLMKDLPHHVVPKASFSFALVEAVFIL